MNIVERYCFNCKALTKHTSQKETRGAERVWFGVFTLGMTELMNDTCFMCTECEKKTKE